MRHDHGIETILEAKRRRRSDSIELLRCAAMKRGENGDLGLWSLVYDLERAPITTNLEQLAEIGMSIPDERVLEEEMIPELVKEVVDGLASIDVFLLHTDHLDDRELLRTLRDRVLREPVRDIPPGVGSREWIDLAGGDDRSAFLAVHADDLDRSTAADEGEIVPDRIPRRANRDRSLPRPPAG